MNATANAAESLQTEFGEPVQASPNVFLSTLLRWFPSFPLLWTFLLAHTVTSDSPQSALESHPLSTSINYRQSLTISLHAWE